MAERMAVSVKPPLGPSKLTSLITKSSIGAGGVGGAGGAGAGFGGRSVTSCSCCCLRFSRFSFELFLRA